jgi:hypothetical protein
VVYRWEMHGSTLYESKQNVTRNLCDMCDIYKIVGEGCL